MKGLVGAMEKAKNPIAILQCNFCGKVFTRSIRKNTYEIACPKCKEIDVELIGIRKEK